MVTRELHEWKTSPNFGSLTNPQLKDLGPLPKPYKSAQMLCKYHRLEVSIHT
jgi:hypothetical protein